MLPRSQTMRASSAIEEQLTALNASLPLELDGLDYPATDPISDYQSFKELRHSAPIRLSLQPGVKWWPRVRSLK